MIPSVDFFIRSSLVSRMSNLDCLSMQPALAMTNHWSVTQSMLLWRLVQLSLHARFEVLVSSDCSGTYALFSMRCMLEAQRIEEDPESEPADQEAMKEC